MLWLSANLLTRQQGLLTTNQATLARETKVPGRHLLAEERLQSRRRTWHAPWILTKVTALQRYHLLRSGPILPKRYNMVQLTRSGSAQQLAAKAPASSRGCLQQKHPRSTQDRASPQAPSRAPAPLACCLRAGLSRARLSRSRMRLRLQEPGHLTQELCPHLAGGGRS